MPGSNDGETTIAAPTPFSVVTFNVRYAGADDGVNSWSQRAPVFDDVLRELDPDILGTQEALLLQIEAIQAVLPDHRRIGVGRVDGIDAGEWSAIFVRKSRFDVLQEGNFWFSETPLVPGTRAWDAPHHPRLCTWAHLADKENPRRSLFVYNSHWDNEGVIARENSAALLAEHLARRSGVLANVPAIVTGDFNCTPESEPVRYLTGGGPLKRLAGKYAPHPNLRDSWGQAHSSDGEPSGTFHGFRGDPDGDRIDYILLTESIDVLSCEIIRSNRSGQYPSDHFPIRALLRIS